jgi:hypothetical protein
MFEKEIKFIIDFTLNRIKKLGSFFTYEKLASAEVHPAIITYISAHLDYLIYDDRKKLLQNSAFDYSGSEISKYFNLIGEEIKRNKRLAFEDVKTLVTHAVTFNINYLVRPNWTLAKLIFADNNTRNVNEIKMMLNYLYFYDYIKNVFLGYFSKRRILSLSETEFDMILGKIDHQMFNERTRDLIDNALVSISDFFNEGGVDKKQIPASNVELFLKEKNLMEELFKLRRSIPAEDKRKYELEDIRRILYSKETVEVKPEENKKEEVTREESKDEVEETIEEQEEIINVEDTAEEETVSEEPEAISEDEEILAEPEGAPEEDSSEIKQTEKTGESNAKDDFISRYQNELRSLEELEAQLTDQTKDEDSFFEELDEKREEEKPEQQDEKVDEQSISDDEIKSESAEAQEETEKDEEEQSDELIIEEEEINAFDDYDEDRSEDKTTPAPRRDKDILGFLSDKEMEKIVSNVFNEDEDDFVTTMENISDSSGYNEATEILKAVFSSYKVNPYSRDAVTLTNAVSNYFDQG